MVIFHSYVKRFTRPGTSFFYMFWPSNLGGSCTPGPVNEHAELKFYRSTGTKTKTYDLTILFLQYPSICMYVYIYIYTYIYIYIYIYIHILWNWCQLLLQESSQLLQGCASQALCCFPPLQSLSSIRNRRPRLVIVALPLCYGFKTLLSHPPYLPIARGPPEPWVCGECRPGKALDAIVVGGINVTLGGLEGRLFLWGRAACVKITLPKILLYWHLTLHAALEAIWSYLLSWLGPSGWPLRRKDDRFPTLSVSLKKCASIAFVSESASWAPLDTHLKATPSCKDSLMARATNCVRNSVHEGGAVRVVKSNRLLQSVTATSGCSRNVGLEIASGIFSSALSGCFHGVFLSCIQLQKILSQASWSSAAERGHRLCW